jgi:hypothetical protein
MSIILPSAVGQRIEKDMQETFKANKSTLLDIDSKFGEVRILAWDKDVIEVNASLWVESNRSEYAKELLSQLDAEISFSDNTVAVQSVFPERLNTRKDTKFSIDFTINVPAYINLDLSSKYGSAFIDELTGHANIYIAYGNLKIMELTREQEKPLNTIDMAYSSGSIQEAGWVKMDMSYSKISIDEAQALVVISKYSGLSVDECSSIVIQSKYDTYSIGELNNFLGELKYGNLKIEELSKKLEIESAYTSVKVEEIGPQFEMIKIDNSRGGIKLGISENSSFTIKGTAIRGDISVSGMNNLNRKVENANKYIDGSYGNNPAATIDIQVKEGDVKIDLN